MDYTKHTEVFSNVRMLKYLEGASKNTDKATHLYKNNINLSQAIYPLISILEVGLRNAIDKKLRSHFSSSNWILEQRKGFMIHPDLTYKDRITKAIRPDTTFTDKIAHIENKFRLERTPLLHNKIVGELSLGFWTKFYDSKPVKVLKGTQIQAFKNSPGVSASQIYSILNDIRALRNRISHHEPVCFNETGQFCIKNYYRKYLQIREVLRWIDDDLFFWSANFDKVPHILRSITA